MANGRGRFGGRDYDDEYETEDLRYGGPYERGRRPGMGGQDYGQQRGEQFSGGAGYSGSSAYGQSDYARGGSQGGGYDDWSSGGGRFSSGYRGGGGYGGQERYSEYRGDRSRRYSGAGGRFYGGGERGYEQGERDFWDKAGDEVSSWFGDRDAERRREMDQHRGRGPKGYMRSDERIKEDVNDRLTDDGSLDASEIEVDVTEREVTLSGTVGNRFDKRRAEDLAESVSGVSHVQNNIRVRQNEQYTAGAATMPVR
jgi:osmotically-inducible protein OsmY